MGAPPSGQAVPLADTRCTLGEGAIWSPRRGSVFWTDIEGSRLWTHAPATSRTHSWRLPDRLGSLAECQSGRLLLAFAKQLCIAAVPADGSSQIEIVTLASVEPDRPAMRVNDGRTDRHGNFVFGTLNEDPDRAPTGSFYQFSMVHGLRRLDLPGAAIPNSICFSIDGRTMYFCDSPVRCIMQCDYDAEAARVERVRPFTCLKDGQGSPDGSTVDANGCLWNAEWGEACVRRYLPDGRLERSIAVRAKHPTSVVFGGPTYERLYITSSRQELLPEELARVPESGSLFVAAPGVTGVPDALFRDGPQR